MDVNEGQLTMVDEEACYIVFALDVLVLCLHHAHYHLLHLPHVSLTVREGGARVCGVLEMCGIYCLVLHACSM